MRRRRENFEFYDITNRISSAKTVFLKAFWSVFGVETHGNIGRSAPKINFIVARNYQKQSKELGLSFHPVLTD